MATVTGLTAERILELLAEWETVQQQQETVAGVVNSFSGTLAENRGLIDELNNVTLPILVQQLEANDILLANLSDTILPGLEQTLSDNELMIENLNNITLPNLSSDLSILNGKFPITAPDIAADAVTANAILAEAIIAGKIASDAVTANTIAAGAVIAGKINAGAVVAGTVAAGAVTAGTIAAGAILAGTIAAGAITATELAAGSVTALKIATGAIIADKINAGAITAEKIATGAITTEKLSATAINGMTITGATIRTGTTGIFLKMQQIGPSGGGLLTWYNGNESYLIGGISGEFFGEDGLTFFGPNGIMGSGRIQLRNAAVNVYGNLNLNGGKLNNAGDIYATGEIKFGDLADSTGGRTVVAGQQGVLSAPASSLRYKENYRPMTEKSALKLLDVDPIVWQYKDRDFWGDRLYGGFPAEGVHDAGLSVYIDYDRQGRPDNVRTQDLTAPLLILIKIQKRQLEDQESRITRLERALMN